MYYMLYNYIPHTLVLEMIRGDKVRTRSSVGTTCRFLFKRISAREYSHCYSFISSAGILWQEIMSRCPPIVNFRVPDSGAIGGLSLLQLFSSCCRYDALNTYACMGRSWWEAIRIIIHSSGNATVYYLLPRVTSSSEPTTIVEWMGNF